MNAKEIIKFLTAKGGFKTTVEPRGAKIAILTTFHGRHLHTLRAETRLLSKDLHTGTVIVLHLEHIHHREDGSDFEVSDDTLLINPGCLTLSLNVDGSCIGLVSDLELGKIQDRDEILKAIQQEHADLLGQASNMLSDPRNTETLQRIVRLHFPSEPDLASRFSEIDTSNIVQGGTCSPK